MVQMVLGGGGGLLGLAGVLEAGGYAVDGEQEQAFETLALVVLGVRVAQGGQGAELEVGQRVHVGVAERDGAGERVRSYSASTISVRSSRPPRAR